MSKAVMYGMSKPCVPNNRADARRHRKAYQRGRETAPVKRPAAQKGGRNADV